MKTTILERVGQISKSRPGAAEPAGQPARPGQPARLPNPGPEALGLGPTLNYILEYSYGWCNPKGPGYRALGPTLNYILVYSYGWCNPKGPGPWAQP